MPIRTNTAAVTISIFCLVIKLAYYIQSGASSEVLTSYLSSSKSKPKITPFKEVIRARILWLGIECLVKTFNGGEDQKIGLDEIKELLAEANGEEPLDERLNIAG